MTFKRKPFGYWKKEENIIRELRRIIEKIGYFPSFRELEELNEGALVGAILRYSDVNYLREQFGYVPLKRQIGYWTEEAIIVELKPIIKELGHFPISKELNKINKGYLISAMAKKGGVNYFRRRCDCKVNKKFNYWNEETIIIELKSIIKELGCFPNGKKINEMKRCDLTAAIHRNGNFNYFREKLGYDIIRRSPGFWTEKNIINELKLVIKQLNHFPNKNELNEMNRSDLGGAITEHGGMLHFWKIFGIDPTEKQENQSKVSSYISKRGNNSEKIVKEHITKWCYVHNLPQPDFNVKLSKGNVIEFVCETNSRIGVDVINTKGKYGTNIIRKWKHKQYHLHLDELWIVVFSDVFTTSDYVKFNSKSPDNVKVMSINTFMEELQISVDDSLQLKIDNYNTCTFHNKDDFSTPKQGLSKFFKIKPDIRVEV